MRPSRDVTIACSTNLSIDTQIDVTIAEILDGIVTVDVSEGYITDTIALIAVILTTVRILPYDGKTATIDRNVVWVESQPRRGVINVPLAVIVRSDVDR